MITMKHHKQIINSLRMKLSIAILVILIFIISIIGAWFESRRIISPCQKQGCYVQVVYAKDEASELEQITTYIVRKFLPHGRQTAVTALACFISESKLKTDAYNFNSNGTEDRGIAQINSIWGMKPEDAHDWKKNIDKAYEIFLRSNKTFNPWFGKGCH
jgi:hypothetical protein